MTRIHIVTDSSALFVNAHFVQQHPVTVVPNRLELGGKTYREGIDLSAEEMLQLIARQPKPPKVIPPTSAEFVEVYKRLAAGCDAVLSIHASREIFNTWNNARIAAQQIAGQCEIVVIDSQMLCAAQGLLVQVAVKAIREHDDLEEIVRLVRGAIDRLYAVYYVESVDYLLHNRIMSPSHAILGTMLNLKPFVTIEEGHLRPIEKVRTRGQAVERLVEFAVEFDYIEETAILQSKAHLSEQSRMLQDRLAAEFPRKRFPHTVYSPSLAALIGADATGIVILEEIMDDDDEFYED